MGCSYSLPGDVNRDDLMDTGFQPSLFKAPYKVTVTKVKGIGMTPPDLKCDAASSELAAANYTTLLSFKPLLYITATPMDQIGAMMESSTESMMESSTESSKTAARPPKGALADAASTPCSSIFVLAACLMMSVGLPRRSLAMASRAAFYS